MTTTTLELTDHAVGIARLDRVTRARYAGRDHGLFGQTALVKIVGDRCVAQFDRHWTGKAYGWWGPYPVDDWLIEPKATAAPVTNRWTSGSRR